MKHRVDIDLPIEFLHEEMDLCLKTGFLILKKDRSRNWKAGKIIRGCIKELGSKVVSVKRPDGSFVKCPYDRIVFAMAHGFYTPHFLFHLNGDKADNRPANLMELKPIAKGEEVSIPLLHALFCYDAHNGGLIRRLPVGGRSIGDLAGDTPGNKLYLSMSVLGRDMLVHRAIMAMHLGRWPKYVDHKDGDPRNNRVENLRECTLSQNSANSKTPINSRTGIKGVWWSKVVGKWVAHVVFQNRVVYREYFEDIDEATRARQTAAEYHHGDFARHN